jgi:hypothetical protein
MTDKTNPNLVLRLLGAIPIIGYTIRCLREERFEALAWLGLDFVLAIALALILWGYHALITLELGLAAVVGALVLSATMN